MTLKHDLTKNKNYKTILAILYSATTKSLNALTSKEVSDVLEIMLKNWSVNSISIGSYMGYLRGNGFVKKRGRPVGNIIWIHGRQIQPMTNEWLITEKGIKFLFDIT